MSSRTTCIAARSCADFQFISKKFSVIFSIALIACLLAGCAAQMAFRDGKDLIAKDKVEEGLLKFQEASKQDPENFEYRTAYFQTRDRAISSYLEQADRLTVADKRVDAEKLYQRVLAIDSGNIRARDGLRNLDMVARHVQLLKDAEAAFSKNDVELAKIKIGAVLTENPNSEPAQRLLKSITEKTAKPPIESQLSLAYKKPISIEFKDVALKQVFEVISRTSGLNFLFDKDVKTDQKTSIFLKNSTIESAVYYTLLTNQLEQQVLDANTILVYPNTIAKQKDYQEMVVKSFFLTNADAKTVATTLKTILKSRDVVVDEKLNMLIVRDSPEAIKLAEKLVALHDLPEPEVMLEVEVLEVKRTKLLELGVKWPDSLTLTPLSTLSTASGAVSGVTLNDLYHQNSRTLGAGSPSVTINAHQDDTDANLLANPRIRARNHEKAKIMIGDRVPSITTTATATGFVSESVAYLDVGLKLEVEPTIYLDNDVAIKVALEVSNIVSQITTTSGTTAYDIGTRNASTVLRLKDGETQVLAGLINDEDRRSANQIPVLGQIPLLGHLFGDKSDNYQKTEIVLSITPHVVRNIQRPEATMAQFRAGTETSLRQRPESGGRVAEVMPVGAASPVSVDPQTTPPKGTSPTANPGTGITAGTDSASGSNTATNVNNTASNSLNNLSNNPTNNAVTNPAPVGDGDNALVPPISAAQVQWKGPTQSKVGSNLTLQLTMQSNDPISSLPKTIIGFDSQVFQVVNVKVGDFLNQGGAQTEFSSQVDPSGQILINASRSGDGGSTASGTVVMITFRSLTATDATNVQVLSISPSGPGGAVIVAAPPVQAVRVLP